MALRKKEKWIPANLERWGEFFLPYPAPLFNKHVPGSYKGPGTRRKLRWNDIALPSEVSLSRAKGGLTPE